MATNKVRGFLARAVPRFAFVLTIVTVLTALPAVDETIDPDVRVGGTTVSAPRPLDDIDLDIEMVAKIPRPTAMTTRNDDDAIYIASKKGRVYSLRDGDLDVVVDVEKELSFGFEQGLLGVAFTPDGNRMIINFTNKKDASVTRAYTFEDGKAVASSGKDLFIVPKPAEYHNAGNLALGPDDYLYLSLGDGGQSGDPKNNAQSLDTVLGKILRIEVLPDRTYAIPQDNPFAGLKAEKDKKEPRGEIWAYGFRNPWRFSFDRRTGDLWVSDVGRDTYEEINRQPAASEGGRNYGWHYYEGPKKYKDDRLKGRKKPEDAIFPVWVYKHKDGVCAVTGGFVYRGSEIDGLDGTYFYSDFCEGGLRGIRLNGDEVAEERHWKLDISKISSFGQDADGELYMLALEEGVVYKVVAADASG